MTNKEFVLSIYPTAYAKKFYYNTWYIFRGQSAFQNDHIAVSNISEDAAWEELRETINIELSRKLSV